MGSRPRPTAELKIHGVYRADRHGHRTDDKAELGSVKHPKLSSSAARAEWRRLTGHLPPHVLGELDKGRRGRFFDAFDNADQVFFAVTEVPEELTGRCAATFRVASGTLARE